MTEKRTRYTNRFSKQQKKRLIRSRIRLGVFAALLILLLAVIVSMLVKKAQPEAEQTVSDNTLAENPAAEDEEEIIPEPSTLFTVCVDAGHGGKDIGCDSNGRIEKDDALKLAQAVADALTEMNVNVVMTRDDDTFLYLSKRCEVAETADADYLVSLHRNKGDGNGAETWISRQADEETTALAQNIMQQLEETDSISRNRGIKQGSYNDDEDDYYITSNAAMPACILELGFVNDSEDNRLFDAHLNDYAQAIADALMITYTAFHGDNANDALTDDALTNDTLTADTDDASAQPSATGKILTNIVIEDIETLDGTCLDYGQGSIVDDENRPVTSVQYEEKYADYSVHFVETAAPLTNDGQKKIFLTFDEGYEYGCTESILNTLKEKGVSATFFVTLPYAQTDPDLVRRMIDEGHVVGNHSTTHPSQGLPSQTTDVQAEEINQTDAYIKEQFGYSMYLFRFPAGKFSEQSLAVVNNCNYESVFWSFAYVDYDVNNQPDPAESLQKMINKLHAGAIYLLHAESTTNTAVLGEFIDQARALGYEFCVLE